MENIERNRGQPQGYKFDRAGTSAEFGPFIGEVVNNVDPTRGGRLQVYIEQFAGPNKTDKSLWRTVNYVPPFYGVTPKQGSTGTGTFLQGNQQSYGMWFTPPDIGTLVLCVFVGGDPNQGYYIGCIPIQGVNHMIPAIGAAPTAQAKTQNQNQATYFAGAKQLPVTEINNDNVKISENPKFFNEPKPVHSYVAGVLFQQGLNNDTVRGPILSSSQRESPSQCYGISTPGRAIYQGGLNDSNGNVSAQAAGEKLADVKVIARRGGHSFVMDDGDLSGKDNLIRIRTAKGHQITMSDDGNCFYICHANGQTWVELGQEGTLDVFSTNSINLRTEGTINLHADKDVNIYAGRKMNLKSKAGTSLQSDAKLDVATKAALTLFGSSVGIKSKSTLALKGTVTSMESGGPLVLKGLPISLNGAPGFPVSTPTGITKYLNPDVNFNSSVGWTVKPTGTESICTRAPTHEPYPYHNQGVQDATSLESGQPGSPPGAPVLPDNVSITKTE
jgi:hypothetical protein